LAVGGISMSHSPADAAATSSQRLAMGNSEQPAFAPKSFKKVSCAMRESTHRISDPKIAQQVSQRLASCGIRSPSHVTVASANGEVTLSGTVQYQHQRHSALQATRAVDGVRRVVDVMKLIATPRRQ
jgi:osmotically-inducible protein OsmY